MVGGGGGGGWVGSGQYCNDEERDHLLHPSNELNHHLVDVYPCKNICKKFTLFTIMCLRTYMYLHYVHGKL